MDRDALLARVRKQTLVQDNELADADIVDYLNEALFDVAGRHPWNWTLDAHGFNTVIGTANYALPADFLFLKEVFYTAQGAQAQPRRISMATARVKYGDTPGSSSLPPEYYQRDTDLIFVPTPDAVQAVVLRFHALPGEMDTGADVPPFPAPYHSMLAEYAAAMIWEREEVEEKAQFYWARYYDLLNRLLEWDSTQFPPERMAVGEGVPELPVPRLPYLEV